MIAFGAVVTLALVGLWWAQARLVLVRVVGTSMTPTLVHGDRVLVRRVRPERLRVGQVVVVRGGRPGGTPVEADDPTLMIKRVAAVAGDPVPPLPALRSAPEPRVPTGRFVLTADNPAGTDSRHLGWFYGANVLGVTLRRLPPPA